MTPVVPYTNFSLAGSCSKPVSCSLSIPHTLLHLCLPSLPPSPFPLPALPPCHHLPACTFTCLHTLPPCLASPLPVPFCHTPALAFYTCLLTSPCLPVPFPTTTLPAWDMSDLLGRQAQKEKGILVVWMGGMGWSLACGVSVCLRPVVLDMCVRSLPSHIHLPWLLHALSLHPNSQLSLISFVIAACLPATQPLSLCLPPSISSPQPPLSQTPHLLLPLHYFSFLPVFSGFTSHVSMDISLPTHFMPSIPSGTHIPYHASFALTATCHLPPCALRTPDFLSLLLEGRIPAWEEKKKRKDRFCL